MNNRKKFRNSYKLYEKSKKYIPLASQTFSKSSMNFVFGASPLFISKGKGALTWDVDNNKFIDYVLGLLPIILGHCDPDVNKSIKHQLKNGISFSLSNQLELELAKLLSKIIPCAENIRFAKNGSDVTTAAIRLARAVTGKERIATCGYHGWHDWYIGSTTRNLGVPQNEIKLTSKFDYNDISSLEKILSKHKDEFAAVILEPCINIEPKFNFLRDLRKICNDKKIILIFDEIVTGFRIDLGGAQNYYNVIPDLACFGKAMGNGMPISALVGKKKYMKKIEDIFFSGTFSGETLSLIASITTIQKIIKKNVPKKINQTGKILSKEINKLITNLSLEDYIHIGGPNWKPIIEIKTFKEKILYTSLLKQEFIKQGLLMSSGINLCLSHADEKIIGDTIKKWSVILKNIKLYTKSDNPKKFLEGDLVKPIFEVRKSK